MGPLCHNWSMSELAELWKEALPEIRNGVTGTGVWNALNACKPLVVEDGVLVIGVDPKDRQLMGHLGGAAVRRAIESEMNARLKQKISVRVIDGVAQSDWERMKRRDEEAHRLQTAARAKMRAEATARSTWDTVYEQLGRAFAAVPNKALPHNRAKFLIDAIEIVVEARQNITDTDELTERNFARCIERVAQYSEASPTLVALEVLRQTGEV